LSAYSELVKNFEKIRSYMREFYVYGFKSREEYNAKSSRSYDDERRRIESMLGEYMGFSRTDEGKNVFISIDSRIIEHNPFFKALKSKSFTDKDITLHFLLFDILYSSDKFLSLQEILSALDGYLFQFQTPLSFDESTVRKKLKEYTELGIIKSEKHGNKVFYCRADSTELNGISDALNYFSEVLPCGAVGSFLLDKLADNDSVFCFKHHYITSAVDSDVLTKLFLAIQRKCIVTVCNHSRGGRETKMLRFIPLRVFAGVQNGRQHLAAYVPDADAIKFFRLDYLSHVEIEKATPRFDELRAELDVLQKNMWGVMLGKKLEHVEFTLRVDKGEEYIINRLEREKRIGTIEKMDDNTYRFTADLYDSAEIVPWIRSFICRITDLRFSNRTIENRIKNDIKAMYDIYGIEEDL